MARNSSNGTDRSRLALALQQLLDETGLFTRAEWAAFLGVSGPALSQWTNDRTVPRPDLLRMVIDLLRTRGGPAAGEALMALEGLMDEPSAEISPNGRRLGATLRDYLAPRSLREVGRSLRDLSPEEQVAILSGEFVASSSAKEATTSAPSLCTEDGAPTWRLPRIVRMGQSLLPSEPIDIDELTATRLALLVGSPGSGKTGMLRTLEQAHGGRASFRSLRGLTSDQVERWLDSVLADLGASLILIDGLDEMDAEHRFDAASVIDRAAKRSPGVRIMVASRAVAGLERLEAFEGFSIAPMSDVEALVELARPDIRSVAAVEIDRFFCHLSERESLRSAMRDRLLLHCAWTLFERNAVTPFSEAMVLNECVKVLLERDGSKGLNRVREPWASTQRLMSLMGDVSLRMICGDTDSFDTEIFGDWVRDRDPALSPDRVLDLLLVQGLLVGGADSYRFAHASLRDCLAARFVVESTQDATVFFTDLTDRTTLNNVIRLACGLASDATPLLQMVLHGHAKDGANGPLLADLIAQPLSVRHSTLETSCRSVVSWLDKHTSHWEPVPLRGAVHSGAGGLRWRAHARVGKGGAKEMRQVLYTLGKVHVARSGPAGVLLKAELEAANSSFLPLFSESLDVEGLFKAHHEAGAHRQGSAHLAVEGLQLG
jgi:hypothetical protein